MNMEMLKAAVDLIRQPVPTAFKVHPCCAWIVRKVMEEQRKKIDLPQSLVTGIELIEDNDIRIGYVEVLMSRGPTSFIQILGSLWLVTLGLWGRNGRKDEVGSTDTSGRAGDAERCDDACTFGNFTDVCKIRCQA